MSAAHIIATVVNTNIRQLHRTLRLAHRIQDIHSLEIVDSGYTSAPRDSNASESRPGIDDLGCAHTPEPRLC